MKDRDGRPVVRDPTFLAESTISVKHQIDRIMGDTAKQVTRGTRFWDSDETQDTVSRGSGICVNGRHSRAWDGRRSLGCLARLRRLREGR